MVSDQPPMGTPPNTSICVYWGSKKQAFQRGTVNSLTIQRTEMASWIIFRSKHVNIWVLYPLWIIFVSPLGAARKRVGDRWKCVVFVGCSPAQHGGTSGGWVLPPIPTKSIAFWVTCLLELEVWMSPETQFMVGIGSFRCFLSPKDCPPKCTPLNFHTISPVLGVILGMRSATPPLAKRVTKSAVWPTQSGPWLNRYPQRSQAREPSEARNGGRGRLHAWWIIRSFSLDSLRIYIISRGKLDTVEMPQLTQMIVCHVVQFLHTSMGVYRLCKPNHEASSGAIPCWVEFCYLHVAVEDSLGVHLKNTSNNAEIRLTLKGNHHILGVPWCTTLSNNYP